MDKQEKPQNLELDFSPSEHDLSVTIAEDMVPPARPWSGTIQSPKFGLLNELVGFFQDCKIFCTIISEDEEDHISMNVSGIENIDFSGHAKEIKYKLSAETIGDSPFINFLSLKFVDATANPIENVDIKIIQKPEQNIAIAFDLRKAIDLARGVEECMQAEAEIYIPGEGVLSIKESTGNFFWRDFVLYCSLPVGVQMRFRAKYSTPDRDVEWSKWLEFSCKRKMTL